MRSIIASAALAAGLAIGLSPASAQTPLRVAGNFSQNVKQVDIERAFFDALGAKSGVPIAMNYNPMDVVGVKAPDALRMLRGGSFDVMSVQIGMASRDDPFFEGVDLIGVGTPDGLDGALPLATLHHVLYGLVPVDVVVERIAVQLR